MNAPASQVLLPSAGDRAQSRYPSTARSGSCPRAARSAWPPPPWPRP
jgi:hypothetical protein